MRDNIPERLQKILFAESGNRCAMPDCRAILVAEGNTQDDPSLIAVMAHIKGENPGSARYDENMLAEKRNNHENLIIVCPSCHKKIDDQENTYTVDELLKIKINHARWIIESTEKEITRVTFAELEIVTKYLVSGQASQSDSLTLTIPGDKIKKNDLSESVKNQIVSGMTQIRQVTNFIDDQPDMQFADRLRQGFVAEYECLKNIEKIDGDNLFNSLQDFASNGKTDFTQKAAGLAILVYLFERCEVFEK